MLEHHLEEVLNALDVRVDGFAMCDIEDGCSLRCEAFDTIVVHYVLQGHGSIESEQGSVSLEPGTMVVIPRRFPKSINGAGPVTRLIDAGEGCPMADGILKFSTGNGKGSLILACGWVTASLGEGLGLLDHVTQPMVQPGSAPGVKLMFEAIFNEITDPSLGSRALISTFMKQILIMLLRARTAPAEPNLPLYMPLLHPQLGRAVAAILVKPQGPHNLLDLAKTAGMSRSRFVHHFTSTYGRSPIDFAQSVRLRAAARLLRGSNTPVKSVAAAVGYASRSQFSRAFRCEFGQDPSTYREDTAEPEVVLAAGGVTRAFSPVSGSSS
jgi:AraC-like DNA-binding protein